VTRLPATTLRLILLLVLGSQLSGCLLTRVYAFKSQFCDYQANFTLLVDDGVTLQIHKPVLLDSDVVWLLGARPTTQNNNRQQLEMLYVVEKDLPEPNQEYAVPLRLWFSKHDGNMLLSAGMIDKNLSAMITPGLIEETIAHTCDSETSVAKKNVEFDLSSLDRADIPKRGQILDALGPPQKVLRDGREIVYRFRLQGAGPEVEKSYAWVWFGPGGNDVERLRFHYLRYELDADFIAGRGSISIRL